MFECIPLHVTYIFMQAQKIIRGCAETFLVFRVSRNAWLKTQPAEFFHRVQKSWRTAAISV